MKKTDMVRELLQKGNIKGALRIAKSFRLGITKEQLDAMSSAYECMLYPDFYKQIGKNPETEIERGKAVINTLYGA